MALAATPFDLVEAKLAAPTLRPGTLAKAEVVARLCEARDPFVTIVAPAGYGKTTLLASWAEADPRPFAWVALGRGDDDVLVFLRYVLAAIHGVEPVPNDALEALSGPGGSSWMARVPPVGRSFAAMDRPLVLALDDLHAVSNPSCLDALVALTQHVPAGSAIVVASREEPALPLARWRAEGRVTEIGVADLRMNDEEAGLLLREAGAELEPGELTDLTERTEGWPAGLYLAALSIKAGSTGQAEVERFTGEDRFISDYLRLELLSRLPPAEADFLKHTSVLERMRGDLCDAVLDTTGSAQMLSSLERTNHFLVPLDRRGEWYRYHHLFHDLLRQELEQSEPDLVAELNRRAMAWCMDNDLAEAAVPYAHAAGETDTLAGLIDALSLGVYFDGRVEIADGWLDWFDDAELRRYPALAVYGAWYRALSGRPAEAERWLALTEGATSTIPLADGSPSVDPLVANLRATLMPDGAERAVADGDLALAQLPPGSGWIPGALLGRGIAHALLGEADLATSDLTTAVELGLVGGNSDDVYVAQAELALLAIKRGAWGEARRRALEGQTVVDEAGLEDYASSAIVRAVTVRVALHEGRHEDARASLALVHRLRPALDHAVPWLTIQVGLELMRAHLALGDAAAARTILIETEEVLALRPNLGSLGEEVKEMRERVEATAGPAGAWAMSLTGAELRLLPYLATHLTVPEIATRLFISRNTVKTEAVSIYRKLGASSRSEAIERAVEVGLLESTVYPPGANLTQ